MIARTGHAATGFAEPPEDLPAYVRVDARLALAIARSEGRSRIADRHEAGAFRLRFPTPAGETPEAVIVNVAGGLAGGDRVGFDLSVGAGATVAVSSAAAERVYRSAGDATTSEVSIRLDAGARALWLPQETILQEGGRLERRFSIDLGPDANLLFGEMLYLGRRASGEAYTAGGLRESLRVRRQGRLVLADETRIADDFAERLTRPGALGTHVAMATLLIAAEDAAELLAPIRAAFADEPDVEAGASDLGGLVLARLACHDAARLRVAMLSLARLLAPGLGLTLPRALLT